MNQDECAGYDHECEELDCSCPCHEPDEQEIAYWRQRLNAESGGKGASRIAAYIMHERLAAALRKAF